MGIWRNADKKYQGKRPYRKLLPKVNSRQEETAGIPHSHYLQAQEEVANLPITPPSDQFQQQPQFPDGYSFNNQIQHSPSPDYAQAPSVIYNNPQDWASLGEANHLTEKESEELFTKDTDISLSNFDFNAANAASNLQPEHPPAQPTQDQFQMQQSQEALHQYLDLYDLPHFPHLPASQDLNLPLNQRLRAYPQLDTSFVFYSEWLNMLYLLIHAYGLLPCFHPNFAPLADATSFTLSRTFMFTVTHLMTPILFHDLNEQWLNLTPPGMLQVLNHVALRSVEKNLKVMIWQIKEPIWVGKRRELKTEVNRIVETQFMVFFRVQTSDILAMLERDALAESARHETLATEGEDYIMEGWV